VSSCVYVYEYIVHVFLAFTAFRTFRTSPLEHAMRKWAWLCLIIHAAPVVAADKT